MPIARLVETLSVDIRSLGQSLLTLQPCHFHSSDIVLTEQLPLTRVLVPDFITLFVLWRILSLGDPYHACSSP